MPLHRLKKGLNRQATSTLPRGGGTREAVPSVSGEGVCRVTIAINKSKTYLLG